MVVETKEQISYAKELQNLRRRAGLSREELALAMGYKGQSSIQRYEDPEHYGDKPLPLAFVQRLCSAIVGKGNPRIGDDECLRLAGISGGVKNVVSFENAYLHIHELDVRGGAGGGACLETEDRHEILADWRLPKNYVEAHTTAQERGLKIITIYGDGMSPEFMPGDRVMVDTKDRIPSPPGVFVLWDGLGIVVKRVEYISYSDPQRVRISSTNSNYQAYELTAEEIHISGRVVGKWTWT